MRRQILAKQTYEQPYSTQIIITALNEELGIGPTIAELLESFHTQNILVVDGNTLDRTVEIAKNYGADVIFQNGAGKGDALLKSLEHVGSDVDYVVLTDADYTYPAEYFPEMINILERDPSVGMVCGNRFNPLLDAKALSRSFYFGNRLLAFVHNMLNGVALNDPLTGMRVVRGEILRDWLIKSKGFDVKVELNHQVERKGFRIIEVPIRYRERLGEKKLKIKHGATILRRILLEITY
jgi:glycosyltransferase involved in cell wall biosynthesis